jgi:hypothetical protein
MRSTTLKTAVTPPMPSAIVITAIQNWDGDRTKLRRA